MKCSNSQKRETWGTEESDMIEKSSWKQNNPASLKEWSLGNYKLLVSLKISKQEKQKLSQYVELTTENEDGWKKSTGYYYQK